MYYCKRFLYLCCNIAKSSSNTNKLLIDCYVEKWTAVDKDSFNFFKMTRLNLLQLEVVCNYQIVQIVVKWIQIIVSSILIKFRKRCYSLLVCNKQIHIATTNENKSLNTNTELTPFGIFWHYSTFNDNTIWTRHINNNNMINKLKNMKDCLIQPAYDTKLSHRLTFVSHDNVYQNEQICLQA